MSETTRRHFLRRAVAVTGGAMGLSANGLLAAQADRKPGSRMRLGLVTYLWGQDWDLPTLIANCEKSGVLGVELRTTHAHGVEPSLGPKQRREVKKRFADSPVTFVGPGSNERFDHPDPAALAKAVEATKAFIKLSHDCGGSGVKVKPNSFHPGVPPEKTIQQIGRSLNVVGAFGADYGQQIRLEVHGQCSPLPIIKQIMDIADHPNVGVCWNSNAQDLEGEGLEYNFNLVKDRFGDTAHVRELDGDEYPYQKLIELFVRMDYGGWILLECRTRPSDRVQALARQRQLWEQMVAGAQARIARS
ncbi:MAG TPA: twin-arginine translocation signal domain-containing protein [Planctomycetaceae bacterium]|nr:twin-arginine translocation signal domain-containing protein [Planctomycetaceae bacterium]HIQ22549.1 twin-arginine translocation signal domain-containing protein [Planctomycetota bacterium]